MSTIDYTPAAGKWHRMVIIEGGMAYAVSLDGFRRRVLTDGREVLQRPVFIHREGQVEDWTDEAVVEWITEPDGTAALVDRMCKVAKWWILRDLRERQAEEELVRRWKEQMMRSGQQLGD